jgi:hypothetical protein
VTLLDGGTPDNATQFPIASKSEPQFENIANHRIPGLAPEHRELVKKVQPYHLGDKAVAHPLAVLADLSNTDKHRIVNPTMSFMEDDADRILDGLVGTYQGPEPSPVHSFWVVAKGSRLANDEPWFRIRWGRDQPPPPDVRLSGDLKLGIAFGEMGLDASDFKKVANYVRSNVLEAFMRDFPETEFTD